MAAHDPDAPTTVHRARFPYETVPRRVARGSVAMPDRGSHTDEPVLVDGVANPPNEVQPHAVTGLGGILNPRSLPGGNSNALLVSARESRSGRPIAVFGPQTAYFAPQILMEQDIHGPGIDARGASFPGINLYVQLGRGRDYAWSATSAGQDNTDVFAVDLCEPDGAVAAKESMHDVFRGRCLPMEVLERRNSWTPNAADSTPAGSQTLRALRTKLGIVIGRATIGGTPVAYVRLRTAYMHEVDSAGGFADFNNPDKMRNARDFQRAAHLIGYTFNWFYADDRQIAYFNSGNNPVKARNTDPFLPVRARHEWQGFDPERLTARFTPFSQHPRVIDQSYLTSWNNKQAAGTAGAPPNIFSSVYRSMPLDDRIRRAIRGPRKMSLLELIDAMEDAGTVDLRGDRILPLALRALGAQRDPALGAAIAKLRAWRARSRTTGRSTGSGATTPCGTARSAR